MVFPLLSFFILMCFLQWWCAGVSVCVSSANVLSNLVGYLTSNLRGSDCSQLQFIPLVGHHLEETMCNHIIPSSSQILLEVCKVEQMWRFGAILHAHEGVQGVKVFFSLPWLGTRREARGRSMTRHAIRGPGLCMMRGPSDWPAHPAPNEPALAPRSPRMPRGVVVCIAMGA